MARTHGAHSQVNRKGTDGRAQAWQAMRIMRRFTRGDLLTTAQIGKDNLRKFVKALIAVDIVAVDSERVNGRPGSRDSLKLKQDLGPKPPVIWTNGQVFDPNKNEVHYIPEGEADEHVDGEPAHSSRASQHPKGGAEAGPVASDDQPGTEGPVHA